MESSVAGVSSHDPSHCHGGAQVSALGTPAGTNHVVRGNRAHRESHRCHSQRGCSESGTSEEAAPRCPMGNHTTQSVDNSSAHRLWRSPLMWKLADDGVPLRAASASGTAVNATKAKPAITPDPSTKPIPFAGWSAMTCVWCAAQPLQQTTPQQTRRCRLHEATMAAS